MYAVALGDDRPRGLTLALAVLIVAVHGGIGWWLIVSSRVMAVAWKYRRESAGLEIFMLPVARRAMPSTVLPSAAVKRLAMAAPSWDGLLPSVPLQLRLPMPGTPAAAPVDETSAAAPPDWEAEALRAAREATSGAGVGGDASSGSLRPTPRAFGFPQHSGAPVAPVPQFGWDHSHAHRVESLPGGGLVVHLNDQCLVVLNPLPMLFCSPGKKPANGALFEHMRDAPPVDVKDVP